MMKNSKKSEDRSHVFRQCGFRKNLAGTRPFRTLFYPMTGFAKPMCVVLALLTSLSLADANEEPKSEPAPKEAEFTKRHSAIGDKRFSTSTSNLQDKRALTDRRIPMKMWHAEFSSIGQRRAPIDVREKSEKNMIRPELIEMEKKERLMAPQNRRMAYIRNFDHVRENHLVPKYRDAEVVSEREISQPARSSEEEELSMRDLNRFSYQRNHPDSGGSRVQQAGSGEEN